jgi:hypothetical protein
VVLLQQLNSDIGMVVNITGSVLSTDPSIGTALPALNISCGSNCTAAQQKRVRLYIENSTLLAQAPSGQSLQSAAVMSLPSGALVTAANSSLRCDFTSADSIAALAKTDAERISISCAPCDKPFFVAMTSRTMNLSTFSSFAAQAAPPDSCRPLISKSSGLTSEKEQHCPFGISSCSTIANVTVGFWTNFTADGNISDAARCPPNYCGCRNIPNYSEPSCPLFPPFAAEYQPEDALCSGHRTGVLCGGCKQNFTQSLNGFSCVHNDICSETWPWVWTISVVGYVAYALYIVIKSVKLNSGLIMCVLFYGQLSSFASLPYQLSEGSQDPFSTWFSTVTQFGSILSLYDRSCYGLDMGAYAATAAQLCGPAIVLVASLLLTAAAQRLLPRFALFLQKRKIDIRISFRATLINVILLLFSSISSVVFQLITCRTVGDNEVVFVDGTRKCEGREYEALIAVAALLSVMPVAFWALLKFNRIPAPAKAAVCSAYTDSRYYWVVIALMFRFLMTVVFATAREFPSVTAFALLICSVCMLILLMWLRPYVERRTYCMDVFCHACLIVQFALQILVRVSESLGVAVVATNIFRPTIFSAAKASEVLRYAPFVVCALLILLEAVAHRLWRMGFNTGRFVSSRAAQAAFSSVEMRPGNDDLKSSLL